MDDFPDLSLDFTGLKLPEDPIILPVLQPIQVQIDLDTINPPDLLKSAVVPDIPELPDLPPVPSIHEMFNITADSTGNFFPPISVKNRPTIEFEMPNAGDTADQLAEIRTVIRRMRSEYKRFWDSTMARLIYGKDSGRNFFPKKTEQDCYRQGRETCVHAEMDLKERLQRIGSRPAILLWEDFKSIGDFRPNPAGSKENLDVGYDMESCPPEDWACQLLRAREFHPTIGWQIKWDDEQKERTAQPAAPCGFASGGDPIDQARACLFDATLYQNGASSEDQFPYEAQPESIVPSFATPSTDPIIPDPKQDEHSPATP